MYMDPSLTGFCRVGQKLSDVYQFCGLRPEQLHEPSTVCVFLSVVKCGRVRIGHAQTCAHSGIEPSMFAKGFQQGGLNSFKKFEFLTISKIYVPVSQQRLKIEAYKQRTYLFSRPCSVYTPCRNSVKPVPMKKLCRMRMAGLCQFY